MFGITSTEAAVLALCLAGVASALIGRWAHLLSTREVLLARVTALVLPVLGSVIALTMVAMAWHRRRRVISTQAA